MPTRKSVYGKLYPYKKKVMLKIINDYALILDDLKQPKNLEKYQPCLTTSGYRDRYRGDTETISEVFHYLSERGFLTSERRGAYVYHLPTGLGSLFLRVWKTFKTESMSTHIETESLTTESFAPWLRQLAYMSIDAIRKLKERGTDARVGPIVTSKGWPGLSITNSALKECGLLLDEKYIFEKSSDGLKYLLDGKIDFFKLPDVSLKKATEDFGEQMKEIVNLGSFGSVYNDYCLRYRNVKIDRIMVGKGALKREYLAE